MPELDKSITELNAALQTALDVSRFPCRFYGLAEIIPVEAGKEVPVLLTNNKDGEQAVMDDRYALTIYHRLLNTTYEEMEGFGDEIAKREIAEMMMVVWCDPVKLNKDRNRLRDFITLSVNRIIRPAITGISAVKVNVNNTIVNSQELFNQEYNGYPVNISPSHLFFGVRYSITTEYDAACYTICDEC